MKEKALKIVETLQKNGYIAYWAGGCVRDILMKKEPHDFDIVTSAKPEEVKKILQNTIEVGKSFGVMIAKVGQFHFEIATFRSEGKYSDARRPDKVFWSNAKEDAKRRDFTINGMFFNPINDDLIDYVDGKKDLSNRIIKFIGNPNDRIKEDNLRLLRAIRFKNTLNFLYDKRTWESLKTNAYRIENVSKERVAQELNKMLVNVHRANAIDDLSESGILEYILPEVDALKGLKQPDIFHKEGDAYVHTLEAIKSLSADTPITLVWAVLLHDIGKKNTITYPTTENDRIRFNKHVKFSAGLASKICRRLKFSNTEREMIVWLVKNHMLIGDIPKLNKIHRRRLLMDPRFPWLLKLFYADIMGTKPRRFELFNKNLKLYKDVQKEYEREMSREKFVPLLTGADLIYNFKLNPGPQIGNILKKVEDAQLNDEIKTKDEALKFAQTLLKK